MMAADRRVLTLELSSNSNIQRSRVLSLSDLALEGLMSPSKIADIKMTPTLTPTPTQFLFPKCVTAEQEAYANGFAQALEEIYRTQGRPGQTTNTSTTSRLASDTEANSLRTSLTASCRTVVTPRTSIAPYNTNLQQVGLFPQQQPNVGQQWQALNNVVGMPMASAAGPFYPVHCQPMTTVSNWVNNVSAHMSNYRATVHHQPTYGLPPATAQNVFNSSIGCSYTTLSNAVPPQPASGFHTAPCPYPLTNPPQQATTITSSVQKPVGLAEQTQAPTSSIQVNLQDQDQWRLERKRAKNRIAAARCQMRKMERINRLQDKVDALRANNNKLAETAAALTNNVTVLRQQILMHTERGCRLLLPEISLS